MATPIRLVAGLGNPGREYSNTRHNAGFWFADALAAKIAVTFGAESKFGAEVAKAGELRLMKIADHSDEFLGWFRQQQEQGAPGVRIGFAIDA